MTKKERKELEKQLRFESFYRESVLPEGKQWMKDALTRNFKYLTKDFIREMKDYIDWGDVYWYVIGDPVFEKEFENELVLDL